MKKLIILILLVAICAISYIAISKRSDVIEISGPSNSQLYRAITMQMIDLAPQIGAKVSLLVPGNKTNDSEPTWNFRGALKGENSTKPFYGLINAICDDFTNEQCWSLSSLTIDGTLAFKRKNLDTKEAQAANKLMDSSSSPNTALDTAETATDQPLVIEETRVQPVTEEAVKPEEIWHTRTNNVNGRVGPGTDFDIAFKISTPVNLSLVEQKGNWGLFKYKAINGGEGQVWISIKLVKKQD